MITLKLKLMTKTIRFLFKEKIRECVEYMAPLCAKTLKVYLFLVPCQQCLEESRLRLKYESDDILMFFLPNFLPNDNWIFHFPSSLQNPHFVCFPLEESQAVNLCSIRMVTVKTKLARPKSFNKGVIQWNSVELPPYGENRCENKNFEEIPLEQRTAS